MDSAALAIVREDAAPYMRANATPTRDQMHKQLAKLTVLPSASRSILIEVCTLIMFGGKGRCFANNKHFATRVCCSTKTVTRSLDALVKNGLLALALENNDNAHRELKLTDKLFAVLDGKEELTMDRVSQPLGQRVSRGRDSMSQGSGQAVPHNRVKEEVKEITLVSGIVAQLESALAAACAATQKKEAENLSLVAELKAIKEELADGRRRGRALYEKNSQTIAELTAQLASSTALVPAAKPAKPAKAKATACLMSESFYALVAPFKDALAGTDYAHADLDYYHEVIFNWSLSKAEKRADWIATAKGWMLRDSKRNELKTNQHSQRIPNEHDRQQQSARAQQLGLVDTSKSAAAAARRKELGLD